MVLISFRLDDASSKRSRELFLTHLASHDLHFDAAEVSPDGSGRIEFSRAGLDAREVRECRKVLADLKGVSDVEVSLGPDGDPPA